MRVRHAAVAAAAVLLAAGSAERVEVGAHGGASQTDTLSRSRALGGCHDERPDCAELAGARLENCAADTQIMLKECRKTCESCAYRALIDEALSCADTNDSCQSWADAGECAANCARVARRVVPRLGAKPYG